MLGRESVSSFDPRPLSALEAADPVLSESRSPGPARGEAGGGTDRACNGKRGGECRQVNTGRVGEGGGRVGPDGESLGRAGIDIIVILWVVSEGIDIPRGVRWYISRVPMLKY